MAAVTATYFQISDYGGDAKELEDLSNIDLEISEEGEGVINTIRRARTAKHHKRGTLNYTVEIEAAVSIVEEVDWRGLQRNGTLFVLTYEEANSGRRYQLRDCRVTGVSTSNDAEGEYTMSISIRALSMEQIS